MQARILASTSIINNKTGNEYLVMLYVQRQPSCLLPSERTQTARTARHRLINDFLVHNIKDMKIFLNAHFFYLLIVNVLANARIIYRAPVNVSAS